MKMYLGLDVHSKNTVYCCQDGNGKVLGQGEVPTSLAGLKAMIDKLTVPKGTQIGLESGTQATWVSRVLFEFGMHPVVIDAREVRAKARRKNQKSDRRDAFDICDGLRRNFYESIVYVPSLEVERLRRILSRRRHFVRICVMETNAAKFLGRSIGAVIRVELQTPRAWEKLLESPDLQLLREHLELHARQWALAHEQVKQLEAQLDEALRPFEKEVQLLTGVAGIGKITAGSFIAVVGDPKRFADSSKLASYLGLVPSQYDTGPRVRHGHITKAGSPAMRALLCEASHHAARPSHFLYPYWSRIHAKKGYKLALVAVAHRLARILFQMWRKAEPFDITKLNLEYAPARREKVVLYRLKAG